MSHIQICEVVARYFLCGRRFLSKTGLSARRPAPEELPGWSRSFVDSLGRSKHPTHQAIEELGRAVCTSCPGLNRCAASPEDEGVRDVVAGGPPAGWSLPGGVPRAPRLASARHCPRWKRAPWPGELRVSSAAPCQGRRWCDPRARWRAPEEVLALGSLLEWQPSAAVVPLPGCPGTAAHALVASSNPTKVPS
jgi:hypothetical protein